METAATQSLSLGAVARDGARAVARFTVGGARARCARRRHRRHARSGARRVLRDGLGADDDRDSHCGSSRSVLHRRPNLDGRALVVPGLLALLLAWTLASSTWGSPSEAVPEAQRTLLYVSAALARAGPPSRHDHRSLDRGLARDNDSVLLRTRGPSVSRAVRRLRCHCGLPASEPVGYWNALGLLAALGALLAFGLAARGERLGVRIAAGASTVPLALTCYFTFSRGAWIALAIGIVAALLLDPRRLQLGLTMAIVAPWPALAVLLASSSGPLTEEGGHTLAAAAEDGRTVAAVGVGLALAAAGAVTLVAAFESRVRPSSAVRRIGNVAAVGGAVVLAAAGVLGLGGRLRLRSRSPPAAGDGVDLNERLFSLSGNGRVEQWRVALDDAFENPVVGSGAGASRGTGSSIVPARGRSGTRTRSTSRCSRSSARSGSC